MDLLSIQIRIVLMIGFIVIALLQTGILIYFWKKIELWQKTYAVAFILVQIYVIDALRDGVITELDFKWRLIPLGVALLLLVAHAFVPLRRRKRETTTLNTEVFQPKKEI